MHNPTAMESSPPSLPEERPQPIVPLAGPSSEPLAGQPSLPPLPIDPVLNEQATEQTLQTAPEKSVHPKDNTHLFRLGIAQVIGAVFYLVIGLPKAEEVFHILDFTMDVRMTHYMGYAALVVGLAELGSSHILAKVYNRGIRWRWLQEVPTWLLWLGFFWLAVFLIYIFQAVVYPMRHLQWNY